MNINYNKRLLFCENVLGLKLADYQKELLKIINNQENIYLTIPRCDTYINLESLKLINMVLKAGR